MWCRSEPPSRRQAVTCGNNEATENTLRPQNTADIPAQFWPLLPHFRRKAIPSSEERVQQSGYSNMLAAERRTALGWSQGHPPSVSRKNTTRTSFVQMGAAEPTKVSPQLTEGTATAAGRPEARVTREKGDRRRPEATGGDRRRPEATGGDRRRPEAKPERKAGLSNSNQKKHDRARRCRTTTTPGRRRRSWLAAAFMRTTTHRHFQKQRQRGSTEERRGAVPKERTAGGPRRKPTEHHTQRHQRQQQRGQRKGRERTRRDAEQSRRPEIEKGNSAARSL